MLFTTSWDDGHPHDLKVADLLEKYHCTGTFYICRAGHNGAKLSEENIRKISLKHEVGAHTLTHPSLPTLTGSALEEEVRGSKEWLEKITGKECRMFAYPFGHYTSLARDAVEKAGFQGARTTVDLQWKMSDPFLLPTTLQLHPFPLKPVWNRHAFSPLRSLWGKLNECHIPIVARRSWMALAKAVWRHARETKKPWFHLWGHSWAIEKFSLWNDFEAFLQFISQEKDVQHGCNSDLHRAS